MDDGSAQKLQQLETKIDAILVSVEKTRRHFQITMWLTVVFLIVPLILTVFVVPMFLNSYLGSLSDDAAFSTSENQSQRDLMKELLQ